MRLEQQSTLTIMLGVPGLFGGKRMDHFPDLSRGNKCRLRAWRQLRAEVARSPEITARAIASAPLHVVNNIPDGLAINGKLRLIPEMHHPQGELTLLDFKVMVPKRDFEITKRRVDGSLMSPEIDRRTQL